MEGIIVHALQEGSFSVGRDKVFVPFDLQKDELNERTRGSLLVEVQPFLVINNGRSILFDMGLGCNNADGVPMLFDNLEQLGLQPSDIDAICMSHLHKDHSGGLKLLDAFSSAEIYIYQSEYEFALSQGMPSYDLDVLNNLMYNDKVQWLTEEQGVILDNIQYFKTGGHCPEHIAYKMEDNGQIVFFGGDELPQYKQLIFKYIAKYDYNGERAMLLRKEWLNEGKEKGWKYLFYHDIKTPYFQF